MPIVQSESVTLKLDPDKCPPVLFAIQWYWKKEADKYGDEGSPVSGAGFYFYYQGVSYFMPPLSKWQGSISWEHYKDKIESMLKHAGAISIYYEWGTMD